MPLITDYRLPITGVYTLPVRRALFLYNPISGQRHNTRLRDVTVAAEVFRAAGVEAQIEPTQGPGTAPQQARAASDADFDAVIVCGGDGSVHEALQGLVNRPTALGMLPLGTGNALGNDLSLPRDPARAAKILLTAQVRPLRLPRMDFADPLPRISERSRYFIVGAGMGADAFLLYRLTLAAKSRWGMAAYYAQGWRQWATYPYPLFEVEFRADGELRRERVSQVLAIRVEWFGGFLRRLAPGASLGRDDLRLVLVKSRRRWPYLRYVTGVQFNRAWLGRDIELVYATELTCRAIEPSPRIYAEADGELLSTLPVTITMTDATVNLLVPR
jgi:diacylglycerol kinase family enzyme